MAAKTRTNLTSLERLERQLQAITPDRAQGDAWEKALKGWINAGGHPELTKAWMWGEWPGKLKAGLKGDKGVDLVAETRDKQLVAIQVKFRRDPNDPVTAPEVQKLVGSYRKHFTLFALASNAWSATRGVSEAVGDEDAMLILREQLLESNYDWAAKKSIKRTKFTPFPFQKVAAENVRKALEKGGRAQIVMACGTGKTVTMLLAAEALDAQRVLVLAPTLLLVKQLRDEWVSKRRPDREWASLAVCSDIGDGVDAAEIAPAEFGAPPTTDPDDIAAFLKKPGRRVVFGTYASSDRIAKAQKKAGVPAFDLAVADEAHRIAGVVSAKDKSERSQRVMLEEKEIKAVRRLFATATPRITGSKKTREGDEILIESMDDESRFGKVAHSVTFREAVKLKRLVPYKLVVTIVTDDDVAEAVHNRKFIDVNGKKYGTDDVATAIAIRRAYKELGISKIISYHSRVAGARAFADLIAQVPGRGKPPVTEHVAGSMPVNDRKQVLNRLAAATEPYLVTNARCLTEGIDVPALDAVAFADPRKSQVDIVQAVGRAMRRPIGTSKKTTGYIILPVYLLKQELKDPEAAVEGSAFEPVLQVLRALKDHDPFMAIFMARVLFAKGKKPHQKSREIGEILEVAIGEELDKALAKRLLEAVQLRAIEVLADRWEYAINSLKAFMAREGHTRVPALHHESNFALGRWANRARGNKDKMKLSRRQQLDELGFVWNILEADFHQNLNMLKDFIAREGHGRVPVKHVEKGAPLGMWVFGIRQRKGELAPERIERLNEVGFSWDPISEIWELQFIKLSRVISSIGLQTYRQGRASLPGTLNTWSATQRHRRRTGSISDSEISRLDQIGFLWDPDAEGWQYKYKSTLLFFKDGLDRARFKNDYGFDPISWLHQSRSSRKNGKLTKEQEQKLKSLDGFLPGIEDRWMESYDAVKEYLAQSGSLPGQKVKVGSINVGSWLNVQRQRWRDGELPISRVHLLESLGVLKHPRSGRWDSAYLLLRGYVEREGHLPTATRKENGFAIGAWCSTQRADKGSLTPSQIKKLDALGFDWSPLDSRWELGLQELMNFAKKYGHTTVPDGFKVNGFKLSNWLKVRVKQKRLGKLAPEKVRQLEALGITWIPRAEADWERKFALLEQYFKEFGHTNVPISEQFLGERLGQWVGFVRTQNNKGELEPSRIRRLNKLKFVWKGKSGPR